MRFAITATIFFISMSASIHAQSLPVNGANLYLGQNETEARAQIKAAGMEMKRVALGENSYVLGIKQAERYDLFGEVSFEKGKVSWIDREWYLNKSPDDKNVLANIFYSAAASLLEGKDQATCTITVKTQDFSPSQGITKTTKIECVKAKRIHALVFTGTDCSAGCSIGDIAATLAESVNEVD
jgi:hypothetical protein